MIAFRRLSHGPTVPDMIRAAADERAARWARLTPAEIWARPETRLLLHRRDDLPAAPAGCTPPATTASCIRLHTDYRGVAAPACLVAANLVLWVARLLLRGGLITPQEAATALRWSCWLTRRGMQSWRDGRLRTQR
jgi:hypothetical protein